MRLLDDEAMEVMLEIRDALAEQLAVLREVAGHLDRQAGAAAGFAEMVGVDMGECGARITANHGEDDRGA